MRYVSTGGASAGRIEQGNFTTNYVNLYTRGIATTWLKKAPPLIQYRIQGRRLRARRRRKKDNYYEWSIFADKPCMFFKKANARYQQNSGEITHGLEKLLSSNSIDFLISPS